MLIWHDIKKDQITYLITYNSMDWQVPLKRKIEGDKYVQLNQFKVGVKYHVSFFLLIKTSLPNPIFSPQNITISAKKKLPHHLH